MYFLLLKWKTLQHDSDWKYIFFAMANGVLSFTFTVFYEVYFTFQ